MLLEVKNLSHIYNSGTAFEKIAVKNISFSLNRNEFLAIIGHTGSGKSTLIQHFNALIKPDEGQVLLDGSDIFSNNSRLKEIRQRVGLVFQYPEHQLFEVTVEKDVAFGPRNMGLSEEEVKSRVREALTLVGIPEEIYGNSPFELSGGQKRRVAIAGVLAMRPEVLVLDEPTAGLDPGGRDEILDKIREMREKLGISVILVSHSMEDIARLADRIIVLANGEIALSGTPSEVFENHKRLEEIGLAAPQVSRLIAELNRKGFGLDPRIYTVEAAVTEIYRKMTGLKNA